METQNTVNDQCGADQAQHSSAEASSWPSDSRTALLRRVDAFEASGVERTEPFAAFLGAILAELIRGLVMLEVALQQSWRHSLGGVESLRAAHQAMTQYLRAARQIEQYTRLEIQIRNAAGRHRDLDL